MHDDLNTALHDWQENCQAETPDERVLQDVTRGILDIMQQNPNFDSQQLRTMGLAIAKDLLPFCPNIPLLQAAALLPATREFNNQTLRDNDTLPQPVCDFIIHARKMDKINSLYQQGVNINAQQTMQCRKLLLALVNDIRVVLLKICEHLSLLKQLSKTPIDSDMWITRQGLEVFAPLANRLGLGQLKWQLEDLSFRALNKKHIPRYRKWLTQKKR